jgi:hypothetical protein
MFSQRPLAKSLKKAVESVPEGNQLIPFSDLVNDAFAPNPFFLLCQ